MSRRQRLPAPERRRQILAAAMRVFADRGYHRASLEEIAAAAGVSKALIYEHFPSKAALKSALLTQHGGDLLRRVAATDPLADPDVQLRAGLDAFFGFVDEHRVAWAMLQRELSEPMLRDTLRSIQDYAGRTVAEMYLRAGGEEMSDVRAQIIARLVTGGAETLATWWLYHPEVSREELLDAAMDGVWIGLQQVAQGRRYLTADPTAAPAA